MSATDESEVGSGGPVATPIVIDMGSTKRKNLKNLKRGRGRLLNEITDVVDRVREELGDEAHDKELVPVVIMYRRKKKRRRKRRLPFRFLS